MMGYLSLPHRPITRLDRLTSSNSILTRLLAIVGIIFLIERTASFFSSRASFSSVTNHHVTLGSEHILSYDNENSGLIKETGETKAIIVASTTWENTSWIHEHFSDWNLNIYVRLPFPSFLLAGTPRHDGPLLPLFSRPSTAQPSSPSPFHHHNSPARHR